MRKSLNSIPAIDLAFGCFAESGSKDAPSIDLPHQHPEYISHIALDIGGSLVKLVYFSPEGPPSDMSGNGHRQAGGDCLAKLCQIAPIQAAIFCVYHGLAQPSVK